MISAIGPSCVSLVLFASGADSVFERVAPAVFPIHVEKEDGTVESSGSGFFVGVLGDALTAYHVIDDAVFGKSPRRLVAVVEEKRYACEVVEIDPDMDLALLRVDIARPRVWLARPSLDVRVGTETFSLGKPGDTGVTIIGGTFRGDTERGFLSIGAELARGMSGGPTVERDGAVIGVNSGKRPGEVVGQVAPIARAMARGASLRRPRGTSARERYFERLLERQEKTRDGVMSSTRTMAVGDFVVLTPPPCKSQDATKTDDIAVKTIRCAWDVAARYADDHLVGGGAVFYTAYQNRGAFLPRFLHAVRKDLGLFRKDSKRATNKECETHVVWVDSLPMKVVACRRDLVDFSGLREFFVSAVTVDSATSALGIDISLLGYRTHSAEQIVEHLLRAVRRKEE